MNGVTRATRSYSRRAAFAGARNSFDRPADGMGRYKIEQGFEMGRPSEIVLEAEFAGHAVTGLRIAGYAVRVASGVSEVGVRGTKSKPR